MSSSRGAYFLPSFFLLCRLGGSGRRCVKEKVNKKRRRQAENLEPLGPVSLSPKTLVMALPAPALFLASPGRRQPISLFLHQDGVVLFLLWPRFHQSARNNQKVH
nr:hypothetical protein [Pandoravirus massiliensis]